MATSRHQPALLGGLLIGALSSIPFVNMCCCLWVICGGLLTVYLQQQNTDAPLETSEAVLGGLLAGLIGAVITCLVFAGIMAVMGPVYLDRLRTALENPDVPPEARDFVLRVMSGPAFILLQAAVLVPVFAILSMLGSLLGLAFFRKKTAPPA